MSTPTVRHSADTLAGVLAPLDARSFRDEYLGRQFLHGRGERGRFSELLPWPDLNDILGRNRLGPPRLRLVREGTAVPAASYVRYRSSRSSAHPVPVLRPAEMSALLSDGATLVLDSIEELQAPIGVLAEDLERALECRIQVNLYAGWRLSPGFNLHWDDHDVLVLQVSGRKHWRVYPMTREHPLRGDRDVVKPEGPPVWDGILEDGEVLYIPRGWWHVAIPMDEPTLHLTVGLHQPNGMDLLEWFVERMRESAAVRQDLPRFASAEMQAAHAARLRSEFERLWDAGVVREFLREKAEKVEARGQFALPWSVMPTALLGGDRAWTVRWRVPRAVELTARDGVIRFTYARKEWTFAAAAGGMLEALQSAGSCTREQFYAAGAPLTREVMQTFLKELLAAGLVTVDSAE